VSSLELGVGLVESEKSSFVFNNGFLGLGFGQPSVDYLIFLSNLFLSLLQLVFQKFEIRFELFVFSIKL